MNEAIVENYLTVIQEDEPEYMTEGMREFFSKLNKVVLKRTIDKIHNAFTRGDGQAFDEVATETARGAKLPKYKEVKQFMEKQHEENPSLGRSVDLARKVIKNTFKIRDKAKLEIASNAVGMTAWVKSKGGKYDIMKLTKTTLQDINSRVMNVYDTGIDNMETNTEEEERMKEKMLSQAKKQEKIEMIVVGVILTVLAAAVIWVGISIWGFFTSPVVLGLGALAVYLTLWFKIAMWGLGIATTVMLGVLAFTKGKGG